ncbi:MAG: hypothetical protein ACI8W8_005008, partial [Rhodothermales bacterium]
MGIAICDRTLGDGNLPSKSPMRNSHMTDKQSDTNP